MRKENTTPRQVGPNADGTRLSIEWADGHVSEYEPWDLRVACPCAGCVDEMTGRRTLRYDDVPSSVHPVEISYVGRYALTFTWSDGHSTGIFPFDYLRRLCPCPDCAEP